MNPEEQNRIVREGYDRLSLAYRADDTPDDYEDYAEWVRKRPAASWPSGDLLRMHKRQINKRQIAVGGMGAGGVEWPADSG